ncbi:hypothetical protein FACS1894184_15410 [Clostridia bacterium]|nr:hypothetical protein FACS1894184_15410 [Clostridia bacterium]
MHFVYCLVSTKEDLYLEQTILSVSSLLYHNPNASVSVLVDQATYELVNTANQLSLFESIKIQLIEIPEHFDKRQRSRWLKTKTREIINGEFIFLDTDTLVIRKIDKLPVCDYGFVRLNNGNIDARTIKDINIDAKICKFEDVTFAECVNSGFFVSSDTAEARSFFREWHEKWLHSVKHGISRDQPALFQTIKNHKNDLTILHDKYNIQIDMSLGIPYIPYSEGIILHLLLNRTKRDVLFRNYIFDYNCIWSKIKQIGILSDDIKLLYEKPYLLNDNQLVFAKDSVHISFSKTELCKFFVLLYNRNSTIFRILNKLCHQLNIIRENTRNIILINKRKRI